MRCFISGLCFFLIALAVDGQEILFPGLEGVELQVALRDSFTPPVRLPIDQARDTLYFRVERLQDSVECVYSGWTLPLPDGVDPSQWLFMNGSGINLEHVYPQSKGADEGMPGHSDMHHLHPSRVQVNEARASHPFADIPDNQTTAWYRNNTSMSSIPLTDIDSYSEARNGAFEPRESVKGNIARAVFYFYTIYQDDADAADPAFFPLQREDLCQWHLDDPVDDQERIRSTRVAAYQGGAENPFILDCTAALRAWCPGLTGCVTATQDQAATPLEVSAYAGEASVILTFISEKASRVDVTLLDMAGHVLSTQPIDLMAGTSEYEIPISLPKGVYAVISVGEDFIVGERFVQK